MNHSPTSTIDLAQERSVVCIEAEPDVTWGRGGIDDYGWTAEPHEASDSEGTLDA
jgi:hypothetical protein